MKRLFLILLVLGVSIPAGADVFVYNMKISDVEFEYEWDGWELVKDSDTQFIIIERAGSDSIKVWTIDTWKEKDPNGKMQNYYEAEYDGEIGFVEAQVGKKLMWMITGTADGDDRNLLTGEAKPTKIGVATPTVAAKLAGMSLFDVEDSGDRYIGYSKMTMSLDKKMSFSVQGLDGAQAFNFIVNAFVTMGYIEGD